MPGGSSKWTPVWIPAGVVDRERELLDKILSPNSTPYTEFVADLVVLSPLLERFFNSPEGSERKNLQKIDPIN
jgi:hypothetical protein